MTICTSTCLDPPLARAHFLYCSGVWDTDALQQDLEITRQVTTAQNITDEDHEGLTGTPLIFLQKFSGDALLAEVQQYEPTAEKEDYCDG